MLHRYDTSAAAGNQVTTRSNDEELRWGPWVYDAEALCLVFDPRDEAEAGGDVAYRARGYYIDLREARESNQLLAWVAQLHNKTWMTPSVVGHLMRAFDDLLDLWDLESALSNDEIRARVEAWPYRRAWADAMPSNGETVSIGELLRRGLEAMKGVIIQ